MHASASDAPPGARAAPGDARVRPDPPDTPGTDGLAPPPPGFGDLRRLLPEARFAVAYATDVNFVGAVLPGYGAAGAWLRTPAVEGLREVSRAAAARGHTDITPPSLS